METAGATDVSASDTFSFDVLLNDAQGNPVPAAAYTMLVTPADVPRGVEASGTTSTTPELPEAVYDLVKFDANGGYFGEEHARYNGVALDGGGIVDGEYLIPTSPSTGTGFAGWYLDPACSDDKAFSWEDYTYAGGEDVVVYAKWADIRVAGERTVPGTDGKVSITLAGGESAVITGLPVGTGYAVSEAVPGGWTLDDVSGESGTLTSAGAAAVFSNTYRASGQAVFSMHKVLENGTLQNGEFTFELRDELGALIQTSYNDADGNISFDPIAISEADHQQERLLYVYELDDEDSDCQYDLVPRTVSILAADAGGGSMTSTVSFARTDGGEADLDTFVNIAPDKIVLPSSGDAGWICLALVGFGLVLGGSVYGAYGMTARRRESDG